MSCLPSALYYLAQGWSVIPLRPRDKRPLQPWEPFQQRRAGEDEVRHWFAQHPDANIGIVTGTISGLLVVDIDDRHGGNASIESLLTNGRHLPDSPFTFTGSRGTAVPSAHLYFKLLAPMPCRPAILPGVDIKADGGYVVAPPSVHPDGGVYEWAVSPKMADLLPAPAWLLDAPPTPQREARRPTDPSWVATLLQSGTSEGQRNDAATRLAGYFRRKGMDAATLLAILEPFAARCVPPIPPRELEQIVKSVGRYPANNLLEGSVKLPQ